MPPTVNDEFSKESLSLVNELNVSVVGELIASKKAPSSE